MLELDPQSSIIFYIFFTAHVGQGFIYLIYTVLQCDLLPLRPHCGEAPGQDSNPWQVAYKKSEYISPEPVLEPPKWRYPEPELEPPKWRYPEPELEQPKKLTL